MPKDVVDRVNAEATKALKLKETAVQLQNDGVAPAGGSPAQFGETIKEGNRHVAQSGDRRRREGRIILFVKVE